MKSDTIVTVYRYDDKILKTDKSSILQILRAMKKSGFTPIYRRICGDAFIHFEVNTIPLRSRSGNLRVCIQWTL